MKILSSDQIRKWDEYTIANEPTASIDLMERAAKACSDWMVNLYESTTPVKVFCGKGNNGGDGLAIARLLKENGFHVDVYILEFGNLGTDDFQLNLKKLHGFAVEIHFLQHADFFPQIDKNDLIVDALFGTGINRIMEGLSAQLVKHINQSNTQVVSIDLPSGLYADKSSSGNVVIHATHTLTFQIIKLSFLFPEHESFVGTIHILDIGLLPGYLETISTPYRLLDKQFIREIYKPRKKFSHKGNFGHALIIAGEKGKMGAAVLCTKACLRAGVGLTSAMVPTEQFSIIQSSVPEAMSISQEEIDFIDLSRFDTIAIGPGIGTEKEGARLVQEILMQYNEPAVLDADALNILSANPELYKEIPPGSILTPHPKEFERLFGKSNSHIKKVQVARQQAKKLFVYILLKGHNSVLACPDGKVYFNTTGNAGMATGGSGDVLTGIITGLLAQGYSSKDAALLGMYLHGLSGDLAAENISEEALLAGDIISHLGKAFLQIRNSAF